MLKSTNGKIMADLAEDGGMFVAARGGAGGRGNHYFASDVNQAPEIAEYGADGEELSYVIEMRTIADVGLVIVSCTIISNLIKLIIFFIAGWFS